MILVSFHSKTGQNVSDILMGFSQKCQNEQNITVLLKIIRFIRVESLLSVGTLQKPPTSLKLAINHQRVQNVKNDKSV